MTRNETCTEKKIEIELGYLSYSANTGTEQCFKDLTCCIPTFSSLTNRCAMHCIGILDINTLNKKLDKTISISVMQDLRMIANCIRQKLGVPDLIETGSSSSGTSVGLPLETDYIFRNPPAFESTAWLASKVADAMPGCLPNYLWLDFIRYNLSSSWCLRHLGLWEHHWGVLRHCARYCYWYETRPPVRYK